MEDDERLYFGRVLPRVVVTAKNPNIYGPRLGTYVSTQGMYLPLEDIYYFGDEDLIISADPYRLKLLRELYWNPETGGADTIIWDPINNISYTSGHHFGPRTLGYEEAVLRFEDLKKVSRELTWLDMLRNLGSYIFRIPAPVHSKNDDLIYPKRPIDGKKREWDEKKTAASERARNYADKHGINY